MTSRTPDCATVSVIIPTHNGAKYICQTIESALAQTFVPLEVLVIDDGSNEGVAELLAPFGRQIRYVYIARAGPAAARNIGIKLSKGKYIALLDHDDVWHRENLRCQVDVLERLPQCSLVYSYPTLIDASGNEIDNKAPSYFPTGNVVLEFLQQNRITTFSATLIRRSVFDSVGLLDESPQVMTCDDYDMWLRISDVSEVQYVPGNLVQYRMHDGNLIRHGEQNVDAHSYVVEKAMANSVRLKPLPERLVKRCARKSVYGRCRHFALFYLYQMRDPTIARKLFWKAWKLEPFVFSNLRFLVLCSVPAGLRIRAAKALRKLRRK
jgi:glycosyltransferase involved in cell wall biosynthesis